MLAPIALFVYNRPWHTKQTLNALVKNPLADQSDLIIFSDGAKTKNHIASVQEVRRYVNNITGFKSIRVVESTVNKGLANSIISGVSSILESSETIIVLEDDMVTSPYFLTYMNKALQLYENDEQVISIHAYIYPVKQKLPETFFLKGADCWGWATWKRGWNLFNPDGKYLLDQLKKRKLTNEFDFNRTYAFTRMLKNQIKGINDSWAIRWYASAFLLNKLTLYPGESLIRNIGNDSSGTHSWQEERFNHNTLSQFVNLIHIDTLLEDTEAKVIISNYFKLTNLSILIKAIHRIKVIIKKLFRKEIHLN